MNSLPLLRCFTLVWIVAFVQPAWSQPTDGETPAHVAGTTDVSASLVHAFNFEQSNNDQNFDDWPDGWNRRTGHGFPAYVQIGIVDAPDNGEMWGKKSLRMQLDGGAAELSSPEVEIDPNYSYALEGWIKTVETERLENNDAWISLTLLSEDRKSRKVFSSQKIRHASSWQSVSVGPVSPDATKYRYLIVTLHLHSTRDTDLFGEAWFDNLRLTHLPKLNAKTSHPFNLFEKPDDVAITVSVSGIEARNARLTFQLTDVEGHNVLTQSVFLNRNRTTSEETNRLNVLTLMKNGIAVPEIEQRADDSANWFKRTGTNLDALEWKPEIERQGFYRVHISLEGGDQPNLSRELSLAIMPKFEGVASSPFGWNMDRQPDSIPLQNLVELLYQSGVHWLAYPVWFDKDDDAQAQRIGELAERLTLNGMELVAVLDEPPASLEQEFSRLDQGIAAIMHDSDLWQPAIDPVMTRLSFKVTWWQLGNLHDMSFVSHPDIEGKLGEIREHFSRFGKNIKLGITWNWLYDKNVGDDSNLDYLLKTSRTTMTSHELQRYLDDDRGRNSPSWTTLQPLDRRNYSLDTRVRDLIERMITAKINEAEAVFIPEPISQDLGVLNEDLSPGELLLPWRTTAHALAEAQYLGQLELTNGSRNYLFRRGDDVAMIVWSDSETTEAIHLGQDLVITDCWGRTQEKVNGEDDSRLVVEPTPKFVTGIDPHLVAWQMNCRLSRTHIDSLIGRSQFTTLDFENSLDFGVSGQATVTCSQLWEKPLVIPFKVNAGEQYSAPLELALRSNVSAGNHEVRIDFDIAGHRRHQMTVYRHINVGIEGIRVDSATQLKNNQLMLHVTVINDTDKEVNFNLYLFAPDRRRKRLQIAKMPPGRARQTFVLNNGDELIGKNIWLRVEEMQGNKILNYELPVSAQ